MCIRDRHIVVQQKGSTRVGVYRRVYFRHRANAERRVRTRVPVHRLQTVYIEHVQVSVYEENHFFGAWSLVHRRNVGERRR